MTQAVYSNSKTGVSAIADVVGANVNARGSSGLGLKWGVVQRVGAMVDRVGEMNGRHDGVRETDGRIWYKNYCEKADNGAPAVAEAPSEITRNKSAPMGSDSIREGPVGKRARLRSCNGDFKVKLSRVPNARQTVVHM